MDHAITLQVSVNKWQQLLSRPSSLDQLPLSSLSSRDGPDPFDCSQLQIPPLDELVRQNATHFVERWRDLDERRIIPQQQEPKWYIQHIRLPRGFDYATRESMPSEENDDGDRVISLQDPEHTLSYHRELWKLFAEIPTAEQIEEHAVGPEVGKLFPHLTAIRREISDEPLSDAHGMSRLRVSNRHAVPTAGKRGMVDTIVFECWKRQLKRGASPDANRMIAEFLGSQTLQDVHQTIVELAEDELWEERSKTPTSGFFFIEGTFYATGFTDYITTIQNWFLTDQRKEGRLAYLGLNPSTDKFSVHSMASIELRTLPLRLGVRYVHVHNGDVECAIFCVDRKLSRQHVMPYPILHDIWARRYHVPECEACQHNIAVIVTATDCDELGHRALCHSCARQLRLQERKGSKIERLSIWRSQADLSVSGKGDTAF